VSGHALVSVDDHQLSDLGPGDYFGEMALLDRRPRSATVTAASELTVLVLTQREFSQALSAVPGLSLVLLENLATRLRDANRRAVH
jgi:CRP/FNR family transcriptional regulator, cyclic AMP receptor protein